MSTNRDTVMSLYAAFGRNDLPAILATLHDDVDWLYHGPGEIPFAGHYHGKEEMKAFFTRVGESVSALPHFDPLEVLEGEGFVVVRGGERGTARSSGLTWDCAWIHVFWLRDGKVSKLREYYDTAPKVDAFVGRASNAGHAAGYRPGQLL